MVLQVEDRKGDRLEYPKAVLSLPFSDVGNTYFAVDDYSVNCSGNFLDNGGGKARPLSKEFRTHCSSGLQDCSNFCGRLG